LQNPHEVAAPYVKVLKDPKQILLYIKIEGASQKFKTEEDSIPHIYLFVVLYGMQRFSLIINDMAAEAKRL
jgi:hypothetical protein